MQDNFRNHTAILVFVRTEEQEAQVKSFSGRGGFSCNRKIARALNRHVEQIARSTGIPAFVVRGDQQVGETFGERFSNAYDLIFQKGFEKVIAIGNDCLSLNRQVLLQACQALQRQDLVLGPTFDGGTYLIGLSRRLFHIGHFSVLPWQQPFLLEALTDYARFYQRDYVLLASAHDANDASSFAAAVDALPRYSLFRKKLKALLRHFAPIRRLYFFHLQHISPFTARFRGPPSLV